LMYDTEKSIEQNCTWLQ